MSDTFTITTIVKRPVNEVFAQWDNLESFPDFMENVLSVECIEDGKSNWVVKGPLNKEIEWTAETTLREPNRRIGWKAAGDSVKTSGQVTFTELPNNATQVTLTFHYVPSGALGKVADQFGNVQGRIIQDLGNFKKYCEGMVDRLAVGGRLSAS